MGNQSEFNPTGQLGMNFNPQFNNCTFPSPPSTPPIEQPSPRPPPSHRTPRGGPKCRGFNRADLPCRKQPARHRPHPEYCADHQNQAPDYNRALHQDQASDHKRPGHQDHGPASNCAATSASPLSDTDSQPDSDAFPSSLRLAASDAPSEHSSSRGAPSRHASPERPNGRERETAEMPTHHQASSEISSPRQSPVRSFSPESISERPIRRDTIERPIDRRAPHSGITHPRHIKHAG